VIFGVSGENISMVSMSEDTTKIAIGTNNGAVFLISGDLT